MTIDTPPATPAPDGANAAARGAGRVDAAPAASTPPSLTARRVLLVAGIALLFAAIVIASVILLPPIATGAALLGLSLVILLRRILFTWPALLFLLAATIMFIPARRYALPIPLPFALEAYRLMIFVAIIAVGLAFLFDRQRRWRPIAFGWPLGIFLATLLVSFIANGTRLVEEGLATTSLSGFFQLGVLLSVFVSVRQMLTSERMVTGFLMLLAWSATIVAFFAIIERVARTNVFLMLANFLPLVVLREDGGDATRAGVNRAYGSAQHPIALAVMLCMIIPLLIYLAKYAIWPRNIWNRRIAYGLATVIVFGGIVAAISRTAVVVMGVMFLIALLLRPKIAGIIVAFAVPMLLLAMFVVPAQVDSMLLSFFDVDTLIASQYTSAGMRGAGRLADLEPAMAEVQQAPFFGQGFGSRIVVGDDANSFILDNQVLSVLMEAGALGVAGYAVFMLAPVVMLLVFAFRDAAEVRHASLALTIATSLAGYSAALFFFDAFGFFQSFLVHMMLLAVGAWVLTETPRRPRGAGLAAEVDAAPAGPEGARLDAPVAGSATAEGTP
ncbi:O-antigen ligase family protein [Microbacterium hominis]|uniref:O-antigen ligase family protein n=1 Tax=Microbacterium hominis TaxID=162426 RepID=A0A7D4TRU5_9MICO|nr:O-antigen ligase family protein [Microbacterium hominis]QKJ20284.1 O-antigen ligase family protein [Microbacterium hominis]